MKLLGIVLFVCVSVACKKPAPKSPQQPPAATEPADGAKPPGEATDPAAPTSKPRKTGDPCEGGQNQ